MIEDDVVYLQPEGWPKTRPFSKIYNSWKLVAYIKMFGTLFGIIVLFRILSELNVLCTSPVKPLLHSD